MKKIAKWKIMLSIFSGCFPIILLLFTVFLIMLMVSGGGDSGSSGGKVEPFSGKFTKEIPIYDEVKGTGKISDDIAQYAYGTAVKYRILPSVVLSQYAYESEWGKSQSAKEDNNFFGATWFKGSKYPKGSSRGVGGSEGGNYMKFPNEQEAFNYYGYMLASQDNFNDTVQEESPAEALLTLGRGGYAAAGIDKSSAYFKGAMAIIKDNDLTKYDKSAKEKWGEAGNAGSDSADKTYDGEWTNPFPDTSLEESSFQGGQLFGRKKGGEFRKNGWHHGLDFGSQDHKGKDMVAVHDGKIKTVEDPGISELGAVVIVIDTGDYDILYQEFANSKDNAKVEKGDEVKAGDKIGIRDTEHLHISITKKDWKKGIQYAFVNNGYWEDPLPILKNEK